MTTTETPCSSQASSITNSLGVSPFTSSCHYTFGHEYPENVRFGFSLVANDDSADAAIPNRKRKAADPDAPYANITTFRPDLAVSIPFKRRKLSHVELTSILSPRTVSTTRTRSTSNSLSQVLKHQLISRLRRRYGGDSHHNQHHLHKTNDASIRFRKRAIMNATHKNRLFKSRLLSPPQENNSSITMPLEVVPSQFQLQFQSQSSSMSSKQIKVVSRHSFTSSSERNLKHKDSPTFPHRGSFDDLRRHRKKRLEEFKRDKKDTLTEVLWRSRNHLHTAFFLQMQMQKKRESKATVNNISKLPSPPSSPPNPSLPTFFKT